MLLGTKPTTPNTHKEAEYTLIDLQDWMGDFVMLRPFNANARLEEEIWTALGVEDSKRSTHVMMRCFCKDFMHYCWCRHTMAFHVDKGQVCPSKVKRSSQQSRVESVNASQKLYASKGPASYNIPKNASLSKEY